MRKRLAEFGILCSVIKVVVCYLLNKRVATFTIVPYCQHWTDSRTFRTCNSACKIHSILRYSCIASREILCVDCDYSHSGVRSASHFTYSHSTPQWDLAGLRLLLLSSFRLIQFRLTTHSRRDNTLCIRMMIFKVTVGSGIGLVLGVWLVGTE